jgi:Asp-tRNA(Asn)/Glu-tRNA(Gln) amidotransferase A subunit family amidase
VTVTGPLAATMADLEISYRIMGVPDPSDPNCSLFTAPGTSAERPKVIGICKPWFERADAPVKELCQKAVDWFQKEKGYEVIDIELPHLPHGQSAHAFTILSEMAIRARNQTLDTTKKSYLDGLNPANKVLLAVATKTPARDYILAQQLRNMLMQHLSFLYQKYPGLLIVTPTTPMAGWPIKSEADLKHGVTDGNTSIRNMEYVWLANFCGNPAINVPVGYTNPTKGEGKVPVGLMAMGDWGAEDQLLSWGFEAEGYLNGVHEGGRVRASNFFDVLESSKK